MHDIDRLLSDLQSLHWWLTAGVFTIVVNLFSAYLKAPIDRWLERRSLKRRAGVEREKQETKLWAKFLLQDQRLLHLAETELLSLRIKVVTLAIALTGEFGAIYLVGGEPQSITGKVFATVVGGVILAQALALFWAVREAETEANRLDYVRHLLQERILGPEPPNAGSVENEA